MSLSNIEVKQTNATHQLGYAKIKHAKGEEAVIFIAPLDKDGKKDEVPALTPDMRFYSSPLIANTAFTDLGKAPNLLPAFTGRDYTTMATHLANNFK